MSTFGIVEDSTVNIEEYNACSALHRQSKSILLNNNKRLRRLLGAVKIRQQSTKKEHQLSLFIDPTETLLSLFLFCLVLSFFSHSKYQLFRICFPSHSHVPYPKQTMRIKDNTTKLMLRLTEVNIQTAPDEWREKTMLT